MKLTTVVLLLLAALPLPLSAQQCQFNTVLPTLANGNINGLQCDAAGRIQVASTGATPTGASAQQVQGTAASGSAPVGNPVLQGGTDGTNVQTEKTVSASNLTAGLNSGALLTEKGPRWQVISNPAAGAQATAAKAAGGGVVRHVADCVSFSAGSTAAPALTALTVNLRDGASGAGTVIWSEQVVISASTGQNVAPFSVCGLNLIGSTNTAMTLEFSASLANLIESVSVSGYDVQ